MALYSYILSIFTAVMLSMMEHHGPVVGGTWTAVNRAYNTKKLPHFKSFTLPELIGRFSSLQAERLNGWLLGNTAKKFTLRVVL